jgi:hypothetical protein
LPGLIYFHSRIVPLDPWRVTGLILLQLHGECMHPTGTNTQKEIGRSSTLLFNESNRLLCDAKQIPVKNQEHATCNITTSYYRK